MSEASYQARVRRPGTPRPNEWTAPAIIDAFRTWNLEQGQPPRSYEWSPSTARALGLPTAGADRWEREYPRFPSTQLVSVVLGSFCEGLELAGLPRTIPRKTLGYQERIRIALQLRAAGEPASVIADLLQVHQRTVRGYFTAHLCPDCAERWAHRGMRCKPCSRRARDDGRRFTADEIIERIHAWQERFGTPPKRDEWQPPQAGEPANVWAEEWPAWPRGRHAETTFGSFTAALTAARAPLHRRRWTQTDILDAMRSWAKAHDGNPPLYREWQTQPQTAGWPNATTVQELFGTWNAAVQAAGLEPKRYHRRTLRDDLTPEQLAERTRTLSQEKARARVRARGGYGARLPSRPPPPEKPREG